MLLKFLILPRILMQFMHKCLGSFCRQLSRNRPMLKITSIQSFFNSVIKTRRGIFFIIVIFILLIYFSPYFFRRKTRKHGTELINFCLEAQLKTFLTDVAGADANIYHKPLGDGEKIYFPYVGNGHVATAFESNQGLYIRLNKALSLHVPFYPIVQPIIQVDGLEEAYALDFKTGLAFKTETLRWGTGCVSINSFLYAHRSRPSVLVQDIRIENTGAGRLTFDLHQAGPSDWKSSQSKSLKIADKDGQTVDYLVTKGTIGADTSTGAVVAVAVAMVKLPSTITSLPDMTHQYHVVTSVHYSKPINSPDAPAALAEVEQKAIEDLQHILSIDEKRLRAEHIAVWQQLWQSGFSISKSKAAAALNGDKINATFYYVLSNVPALLHDITSTDDQKLAITKALHYPEGCYSSHPTLQATTLWSEIKTEMDVSRVVTTWIKTLETHGCATMVKSGAEGVLQGMLLSLGALKFSNDHLEFAMHPNDLHRDFFFRRINYGNNTHLNISVVVGDDNKAALYVALDRNDKPYYACDAGCIDAAVHLTKEKSQFPVKLTKPLTSILYITADKEHIDSLKHVIHVQEINEAPPHEHHVIALHKHGHHFGGLPMIFWVSISFLIITFHLFLFKLIIDEYCQGQRRYVQGKYNL